MDVTVLTQLIGSLGFPIACCIVMFYQNSKMQETLTELTRTLTAMSERLQDVENAVRGR